MPFLPCHWIEVGIRARGHHRSYLRPPVLQATAEFLDLGRAHLDQDGSSLGLALELRTADFAAWEAGAGLMAMLAWDTGPGISLAGGLGWETERILGRIDAVSRSRTPLRGSMVPRWSR